jgi:hypothetical protein
MIVRGSTVVGDLARDSKIDILNPTTVPMNFVSLYHLTTVAGFKLPILESRVEFVTTVLPLTITVPDC